MLPDDLRHSIPCEEFDYQALLSALQCYAQPRKKISQLLAKDIILRIKKGLYVFGDRYRRRPYSREILANLICGPSCVSMEYALHYHGLTPERSEAVTSVTTNRPKKFQTPAGLFIYRNVPEKGFHVGLQRVEFEERAFLMAGPEKALADKLRNDRGLKLRTQKDCLTYLLSSLRIDETDLRKLDSLLLDRLATAYDSRRVRVLAALIRRLTRERLQ